MNGIEIYVFYYVILAISEVNELKYKILGEVMVEGSVTENV